MTNASSKLQSQISELYYRLSARHNKTYTYLYNITVQRVHRAAALFRI